MGEVCAALANAVVEAGFCAYTLPIEVAKPRSVVSVGVSDSLVLERTTESVVHLFDSDGDLVADSKRTLVSASSLNHGLAIHNGYIYASSDTTVYRWSYSGDSFDTIGSEEIIVNNINADGQGGAPRGHQTRTLAFDDTGRLYISVGSNGNVDADSHRSRIRRFDIYDDTVVLPLDFQTGEVFADGLRNEVGLAFDSFGVLWGVENGADNLFRDDLGGDIHQDNPAEELNRFKEEDAGKHWGYPFCWTEYNLPEGVGKGRGTVWAWPSFLSAGLVTDEACQSEFVYVPPVVAMQGHSAPLGIVFYEYTQERPEECGDIIPFPETYNGYAFIAFHGSWNRDVPTGYNVMYVPFDGEGNATGPPVDLLAHEPPNAQWDDGFRPVDVDFDPCGRLIVTSDGTGSEGSKIVNIQYTLLDETKETASPSMRSSSKPSVSESTVSPADGTGTLAPTGTASLADDGGTMAPTGTSCSPCPPSNSVPGSAGAAGSGDGDSPVRPLWISVVSVSLIFSLFGWI